jgi:hypothetical protein
MSDIPPEKSLEGYFFMKKILAMPGLNCSGLNNTFSFRGE